MAQLTSELQRQRVASPFIERLQSLNGSLEQAMARVVELEANASSRAQAAARSEAHNAEEPKSQVCVIC